LRVIIYNLIGVKALSFFLIVCFTAVLTPRQWWHHCSHSTHEKKTVLTSGHTLDEKCAVCDLSLSVFTSPVAFDFHFDKPKPFVHQRYSVIPHFQEGFHLFQLRAPPVV
jgi:hypothetical protein